MNHSVTTSLMICLPVLVVTKTRLSKTSLTKKIRRSVSDERCTNQLDMGWHVLKLQLLWSFRDNGWRQFEQQRKSTKFTDRDSVIKDNSVNESDINIQFQSGDKVNNEGYRLSDPDIETAKKIQLPMKYKMTNFISATRKKETVIEDESDINASQSDYVPSCCENKNKLTDMPKEILYKHFNIVLEREPSSRCFVFEM